MNDPAFPNDSTGDEGLTKREWFAGMALQGILASHPGYVNNEADKMAAAAFRMADTMIEQGASSDGDG